MAAIDIEVKSEAANLRISPRKLNLVAQLIRGMDVAAADAQLRFCRRRISKDVLKCLNSAIANAEFNHGLDIENLYVSEAYVGKTAVMRRMDPRAKGRGVRINKFFSKLTIKVKERYGSKS